MQGFIKKTEDGALILCMTLRQKFADIFWFTLFHEIAHVLNGDTKHEFIDFDSVSGEVESKADSMAGEFLIDSKEYKRFVAAEGYKRSSEIERFASTQNVKDYIVQGRLMKEKLFLGRLDQDTSGHSIDNDLVKGICQHGRCFYYAKK